MKAWRAAGAWLLSLVGCTSAPLVAEPPPTSATTTSPAAARYLAIGDSFTIGTGSGAERSFPARLLARCPSGVVLRNVAVNGYTTDDILDAELPEVRAFRPSFVTLAAGANDIVRGSTPAEYRARIAKILAALRAAHVERIVTLPQPDWSRSPAAMGFGDPEALHARIVEANAILRDETLAAGGVYVNLFPMMEAQARDGLLARDGLHPSATAYDAWAAELDRRSASPCR